jgi:hypothetical protein
MINKILMVRGETNWALVEAVTCLSTCPLARLNNMGEMRISAISVQENTLIF